MVLLLGASFFGSCAEVDRGVDCGVVVEVGGVGGVSDMVVDFRVNSERVMGESGVRRASAGVGDLDVEIDQGTAVGYVPRDVWMIQYGGLGDDAVLIGRPRYVVLSDQGGTDIQAVASSVVNTLFFVANTHDSNVEFGDIGTLGKMKLACKEIRGEGDCYGNNLYTVKDLVFSGKWEGVVTSGAISAELFRNIARLDFGLKNAPNSGMTIRNVQLCNVPREFYYLSGIVPRNALSPEASRFFDYLPRVVLGAADPGGEQRFVFYMPVNECGVNSASTSSKLKSSNAPCNSTYLRIVATNSQNEAYVYRIYPGANMIDDYNLSANNCYRVDLSINSSGDALGDGRVKYYGKSDLPSSNSYILNPAPQGATDRVFTIPIDRANEFWSMFDQSLVIGPTQAWTAELIWQDTPISDFIRFLDPLTGLEVTTIRGVGSAQRIALTTKFSYEGNAVIGIKKEGEESAGYLWSWHLWVTSYDPEYRAAPVAKESIYTVPAGSVHRYQGKEWTEATGLYKDKYIMDRNLGARHAGYSTVGALYYQWGRKDPMACKGFGNVLYDVNGVVLPSADPRNAAQNIENTPKGVTLATGVLNPSRFYHRLASFGLGDWTSQGKKGDYSWNNTVPGASLKSFFDPCPVGWKVPQRGAWADFVFRPADPLGSTCMSVERDERLGYKAYNETGIRYWPKGRQVGGSIFYPATGIRYTVNGGSAVVNAEALSWSATPDTDVSSFSMGSTAKSLNGAILHTRGQGFPVRCVQQ